MLRKILCFVFLLSAFSLRAQNASDSAIVGSWQYAGYEMHGKFYAAPYSNEQLSFYPDHFYQSQSVYFRGDSATSRTEAGAWAIEDGKIIYSHIHEIPARTDYTMGDRDYVISSVNDSILVLAGYEGKTPLYMRYRKIKDIPRIPDAYDYATTAEKTEPAPPMVFRYYLVNAHDTSKRIELKKHTDLTFYVDEPVTDSAVKRIEHSYSGSIDTIADSTVRISAWSENRTVYYRNGTTYTYHAGGLMDGENPVQKNIRLNTISRIDYSGKARERWNNFSAAVLFLSLELIEVAPFVCMNYQGGFKVHRYFLLNGIALSGAAVGGPIQLLTQPKKFKMAQGKFTDKKHWTLEQGKIAEPDVYKPHFYYR